MLAALRHGRARSIVRRVVFCLFYVFFFLFFLHGQIAERRAIQPARGPDRHARFSFARIMLFFFFSRARAPLRYEYSPQHALICVVVAAAHPLPVYSRTLESRKASAPAGSYSAKLFNDPRLLAAKILEEARELVESKSPDETAWETAALFYFAAAACVRDSITLADVESHLERRTLKVQRRAGLAKPAEAAAAEQILAQKSAEATSS